MATQFQAMPMSPMAQPMTQQTDTLGKIDKGLIKCGKFASIIQIVCSVLCIVIIGGIGFFIYTRKDNNLETKATVTDVNCKQETVLYGKRPSIRTKCTMNVKYTVDSKDYTGIVETTETKHKTNDVITIKYDSTNPSVISYKQISNKNAGMILLGVASFIVILMIIHIILMNKSDWYKRIMCVNMATNVVSSAMTPVSFGDF
jgi:hypothetical protein